MLSLQPARINRPNQGWIERERERESGIYNILPPDRRCHRTSERGSDFWGRRNLLE